jgi:hypothetical protein
MRTNDEIEKEFIKLMEQHNVAKVSLDISVCEDPQTNEKEIDQEVVFYFYKDDGTVEDYGFYARHFSGLTYEALMRLEYLIYEDGTD